MILWKISNSFSFLLTILLLLSTTIMRTPTTTHGLSIRRHTTKTSSSSSPYYSDKAMKRMEIPALIYFSISNVIGRILRFKIREIPPQTTITKTIKEERQPHHHRRRRVAIVTGSNTGVGYETSKELVLNHGFEVIIACRSKDKGIEACEKINSLVVIATTTSNNNNTTTTTGKAVFHQPLDLTDFESVHNFGKMIQEVYTEDDIDVLINNAGCNSAGVVTTTKSNNNNNNNNNNGSDDDCGIVDILFQTNFIGHFLLTNILLDKCKRIINLSSVAHHFPNYMTDGNTPPMYDINSIEFWKDKAIIKPPMSSSSSSSSSSSLSSSGKVRKTYGASKLAAILFTLELERRYGKSSRGGGGGGIRSIAVNPGAVNSDIWRNYSPLKKKTFSFTILDT